MLKAFLSALDQRYNPVHCQGPVSIGLVSAIRLASQANPRT
jgi:hypothetical protein